MWKVSNIFEHLELLSAEQDDNFYEKELKLLVASEICFKYFEISKILKRMSHFRIKFWLGTLTFK